VKKSLELSSCLVSALLFRTEIASDLPHIREEMAMRNFDPDALLEKWTDDKYCPTQSEKPFAQCIREAFSIPKSDAYVYRAQAETTLDITQRAIEGKRNYGLHGWYHDDEGKPVGNTSCTFTITTD
jgi:hypothetical protein